MCAAFQLIPKNKAFRASRQNIFTISLGRNAGHTSAAVDFMAEYHNRCILLTRGMEEAKSIILGNKDALSTNSIAVTSIGAALRIVNNLRGVRHNYLHGKDIVIVDNYSWLETYEKDLLHEFLSKVVRHTEKPITAVFHLQ